ncbi:MAG: hypothetical protein PVJ53_11355 [Desulfobacterales bacterium]|jgi:hypothetical protein
MNTWQGEGVCRRRLKWLAAALPAQAPDLVCLQRCLQTWDGDLDTAIISGNVD